MNRCKAVSMVSVAVGLCFCAWPVATSAQTSPVAQAAGAAAAPNPDQGKTVKIRLNDGSTRKLEFVSLTGTELLVRDRASHGPGDPVQRIPLSQVTSVKKTTYKATFIMGAAIGVFTGWLGYCSWACAGEGNQADAVGAGLLFGAMGIAGGAGLGYLIDRGPSHGSVIYEVKATKSAAVAPLIAPHRVGAVMSIRW